MKIVTYNVRCVWNGDGVNSFMHRAGMVWEKFKKEKPDIVAFQEVTAPIHDLLEQIMPDYLLLGQFRSANYDGEGLFTAIRRDTLELIGLETFWLSPTPYVPGSRYENQSPCPRICVMTMVREKETGKLFRIYNVHLDHVSNEARMEGMEAVLGQMKLYDEKGTTENVLLGDLNATPETPVIAMPADANRPMTDVTASIPVSFHNWGKAEHKIDYIFVSDRLAAVWGETGVWDDVKNGIYLSDHYPVFADFDTAAL